MIKIICNQINLRFDTACQKKTERILEPSKLETSLIMHLEHYCTPRQPISGFTVVKK